MTSCPTPTSAPATTAGRSTRRATPRCPSAAAAAATAARGRGKAAGSRAFRAAALRVPLSALAENGARPFLWRMAGGRVEAAPVRLLGLAGEDALIAAELPPGTPVVAFGVHRLTAGQAVRVLR